jgi:hypothetical protein
MSAERRCRCCLFAKQFSVLASSFASSGRDAVPSLLAALADASGTLRIQVLEQDENDSVRPKA